MGSGGYSLVREKRPWVSDRVWGIFCFGNLATWQPFTLILTRQPQEDSDTPSTSSTEGGER